MSKLIEQFRAVKVYNAYYFAGKGNVFITYSGTPEMFPYIREFVVTRPGFKTAPDAAWYDNGCKTFMVSGRGDKNKVLEEAKKWAGEKYGITEWAKTPYGSWMDKSFVKTRIAELKKMFRKIEQDRIDSQTPGYFDVIRGRELPKGGK